jgi:transposase
MDEARIGQQGTLTDVWAPVGSRPTAVKQTRYEWLYLFAAVDPATGDDAALVAPSANTQTMNVFLDILARTLGPDEHAVLILDGAGWHTSKGLTMPANITPLTLPAYSPELNPVENLWHYLRSHYLSNRAYDDYDHLLDAATTAYRTLTKETLKSVCAAPWLTPENHV